MKPEPTESFLQRLRQRVIDFGPPSGHAEVALAAEFAGFFHRGQTRKFTGGPYFVHCAEVASLVASVTKPSFPAMHDSAIIAAAYLHDTVEDCPEVSGDLLKEFFGDYVVEMVSWVTKVTTPADGDRERRGAVEREHLSQAPADAQTVKLADILSNTRNVARIAPDFARVYLDEKIRLLPLLKRGNTILRQMCSRQLLAEAEILRNSDMNAAIAEVRGQVL